MLRDQLLRLLKRELVSITRVSTQGLGYALMLVRTRGAFDDPEAVRHVRQRGDAPSILNHAIAMHDDAMEEATGASFRLMRRRLAKRD